jgi:glycosyltransferase involved in cell wall biosynthesis
MNITVLTTSYPRFPGDGTAPFVKSISEGLVRLGHQVEVVAPYDPAVKPDSPSTVKLHRFRYIWPDRLHIMGHARALDKDVRLKPLVFVLLPFFVTAAFLKLWGVARQQRADLIYAHWVLPNGFIAACVAAVMQIPFVISLHGSDVFVARRNPIFKFAARWTFKRAAGVTACSPELKQAAMSLDGPKNTMLLPWGADPQVFTPEKRKRGDPDSAQPQIIVAALGRFVYKKGFEYLLNAMPEVLQECPQVRLILGGDGSLMDMFQQRIAELGIREHVSLPGRVPWDEVPDFLAGADIFVLPSVRDEDGNVDGLPTVVLEAMSSGAAVIASDIGGVSLVIDDRVNGLLVPPGDSAALRDAIIHLAKNLDQRLALAQSARNDIVERFNWDRIAMRISALLESAAGE